MLSSAVDNIVLFTYKYLVTTVVYAPGYGCTDAAGLEPVIDIIEARGFSFKFAPIKWEGTTITDWTGQFRKISDQYDPKETIFWGFSLGAIIVLKAAAEGEECPAELWLCSLSARFSEDAPKPSSAFASSLEPRQMTALNKLRFEELAARITCPTLLIHGQRERSQYPELVHRVEEAHRLIANTRLVVARRAGHNIAHSGYIKAIASSIA